MKIVGHGIDIVEISEIKKWIDDPRDPFVPRCFTREEIFALKQGPRRVESIAGNFAAKEAIMKAIGTGFSDGIGFADIVITRSANGAPIVHLTGKAQSTAYQLKITEWHLSISHSASYAIGSAIAVAS